MLKLSKFTSKDVSLKAKKNNIIVLHNKIYNNHLKKICVLKVLERL